ncbi:beta-aspartyl-peptidase [Kyrpidia spormannii]|uniref:Isoaspartyl dipeptidase n=1 Tax=Kyrpidia spormannii TaxID=2055160 RepID=A0A6F9EEV4_9BACL|nr:beta-aspartyl-peptidase [Kyrpidia spormannii]CAB3395387.1 Isoaspartyl dipeptidase [Kyrpidia spormannii]
MSTSEASSKKHPHFTLLTGAEVYAPEPLGRRDVLLFGRSVAHIAEHIEPPSSLPTAVVDLSGLILFPGLIDQHVHIAGGGGEGGFQNRTPEVALSHLTTAGVTTVVGVLGTDGTTRTVSGLLAKARALEAEGISTYIYSGAYQVPTRTITDNPRSDIVLIDKVIGVGEIAISDQRSTHPTVHDLIYLASEARVGGMLAGKAGVVHLHIGDDPSGLKPLFEALDQSYLPPTQFTPTHLNRRPELLNDAVQFASRGGVVDITSGIRPEAHDKVSVKPSKAVAELLGEGVRIDQITMSSDSNGSSPIFDDKGHLVAMSIGSATTLWEEIRDMIEKEGLAPEKAVSLSTAHVARVLRLPGKGRIRPGYDADLIAVDSGLNIAHVFARGRQMVRNGQPIVWGTFERAGQGPPHGPPEAQPDIRRHHGESPIRRP